LLKFWTNANNDATLEALVNEFVTLGLSSFKKLKKKSKKSAKQVVFEED